MAVSYHTHQFEIPTASEAEVIAGTTDGKAVTPASLGNLATLAAATPGAVGLELLEDATDVNARDTLGLGTAAVEDATAFATATQGGLADTAVQPGDIGTAAAEDIGFFATAAQGVKADTAVQPENLALVATSGQYADLAGKPTLGTAAAQNSTAFATAAQGTKADNAAPLSAVNNDPNYSTTVTAALAGKFDKSGGTITGPVTISAASPGILLTRTTDANRSGVVFIGADGFSDWALWQGSDAEADPYKNSIGFHRRSASGGPGSLPFSVGYADDIVRFTQRPQVNGVGLALITEVGGGSDRGGWNASTNTPALTTTPLASGNFYVVTVAGTQSVTGSSTAFAVGDQLRSNGTNWYRVPVSAVASVGGYVGIVTAAQISAALALGTAAQLNAGRAVGNVLRYESFAGSSFQGVGVAGGGGRIWFRRDADLPTDFTNVWITRESSAGGTVGNTSAALRIDTIVNSVISSFEWGLTTTLAVNVAGGGEHCSFYAQGFKNADGSLWASCFEMRDFVPNPTTGSLGMEIGMFVKGGDASGSRHGIDMSIGSSDNLTGTNIVTSAIRIGPSVGDPGRAQLVNGIEIKGRATTGINLSALDISYSDVIIKMPTNGKLRWQDGVTTRGELAWNVVVSTWQISGVLTTTSATAGAATALPANPNRYLTVQVNGSLLKIPAYNV